MTPKIYRDLSALDHFMTSAVGTEGGGGAGGHVPPTFLKIAFVT